jgi:hypothetical protein
MSDERSFPGRYADELPPCPRCGREQAVREHWRTVPEGGRPDLCWDSGDGCCLAVKAENDKRKASAPIPQGDLFGAGSAS